ncbi:hypothetical protein WN51_07627 [Melipona quadrifasciata]|uniref:Uncharacterized protein n=1 Tax=Melipona quadrifasciata TaxID=166423 RepID=A0A0M8ZP76_9HYME|nr:hypothetical protein WN51_07627 [Melipona quadrifasciata]
MKQMESSQSLGLKIDQNGQIAPYSSGINEGYSIPFFTTIDKTLTLLPSRNSISINIGSIFCRCMPQDRDRKQFKKLPLKFAQKVEMQHKQRELCASFARALREHLERSVAEPEGIVNIVESGKENIFAGTGKRRMGRGTTITWSTRCFYVQLIQAILREIFMLYAMLGCFPVLKMRRINIDLRSSEADACCYTEDLVSTLKDAVFRRLKNTNGERIKLCSYSIERIEPYSSTDRVRTNERHKRDGKKVESRKDKRHCSCPTISRLRVSNTRLSTSRKWLRVLPIFDVKQNRCGNAARMGGPDRPALAAGSCNNKRLGIERQKSKKPPELRHRIEPQRSVFNKNARKKIVTASFEGSLAKRNIAILKTAVDRFAKKCSGPGFPKYKPQVAARLASMSYRSSTLSSRVCGTPLGWVDQPLVAIELCKSKMQIRCCLQRWDCDSGAGTKA